MVFTNSSGGRRPRSQTDQRTPKPRALLCLATTYNDKQPMALSLSPTDVWKIFAEMRLSKKERIVSWLESAVIEAEELARVWRGLLFDLQSGKRRKKIASFVHDYYAANAPSYYRLNAFYRNASGVIGRRMGQQDHEEFTGTLARILLRRDISRGAYLKLLNHLRPNRQSVRRNPPLIAERNIYFVDDANSAADLVDFAKAVDALDREVAALRVLVCNFKASI